MENSLNCPISQILEYVNFHEQPTFKEISSYIWEKKFLRKLETVETVLDNSYLVSLDLKPPYTSIPNSEAMQPVKTFKNCSRQIVAIRVI